MDWIKTEEASTSEVKLIFFLFI